MVRLLKKTLFYVRLSQGGEAGSHGMVVRLTWSRSKYSFIFVAHMVARSAHMVTRSFLTKMSCIHGKVRRFRAYKRKIEKNSNESTSVCIIALYLCNKKLFFCFLIKPESRRHRATPKNTLVVLSLQQQVSYLRYDSCRPTSTCSQRRPSRSLFILCIVQYIMYIIWLV